MKRSLFVLAVFLITPLLAFAFVRLVAPGIYAQLLSGGFFSFFAPAWGVFFLIICAVAALVMRRNRRIASIFDGLLEGMNFSRDRFYGREYASGRYRGLRTVLNLTVLQKNELLPALPGGNRLMVICAMKVPGTSGVRLHLALTGESGSTLRAMMGWVEAAPGMYLMLRGGQTKEQALARFAALSDTTLTALRASSQRFASMALTAGWDQLLLGREPALKLAGGDADVMSCLDITAAVPLDSGRGPLIECLDALSETAALVERDLSGAIPDRA